MTICVRGLKILSLSIIISTIKQKTSESSSMFKYIRVVLWAMNSFIVFGLILLAIGCWQVTNNAEDYGIENELQKPDTLHSFFGRQLVLNDSIMEQISVIAQQNEMLSYSDSVLQIGDIRWRVNVGESILVLFTSIEPNAPQMLPVIRYITSVYGKPYDENEGYDYRWSSSVEPENALTEGTLVRLRRVRSEEGGTFLIFD